MMKLYYRSMKFTVMGVILFSSVPADRKTVAVIKCKLILGVGGVAKRGVKEF